MMMHVRELEEIRKYVNDATPGAWIFCGDHVDCMEGLIVKHVGSFESLRPENFEFIANAREDIPFLLDEIDRLKAEAKAARAKAYCPDCHCKFPTEDDLDWFMNAFQRHPGGVEAWWKQYAEETGPREMSRLLISIWEAGRVPAEPQVKSAP